MSPLDLVTCGKNVCFGSTSEVPARKWEVRFTLNNGHRQPDLSGPKSAGSGRLMHRDYNT